MPEPTPYPLPRVLPDWDGAFDMRSFGEPLKRLRAVPIKDSGEPLVDLRDACPGVVLHPGCLPLLRETVTRMVSVVQAQLPEGCTLAVGTALRTRAMQRDIRDRLQAELVEKHPDWNRATLQRTLNRMVAPPDDVSPAPHTTGGALDVGVRDENGQDWDFSSPAERWDAAPTYCRRLSETAIAHRRLLVNAMHAAGLTNYVGEWWHWSYGDQGWALRVGAEFALYDAIEVPDAEALRIPKPDPPPAP